jgi:hypothetical protein
MRYSGRSNLVTISSLAVIANLFLVEPAIVLGSTLPSSRILAGGDRGALMRQRARRLQTSTETDSEIDDDITWEDDITWVDRVLTFQYQLYVPANASSEQSEPAITQIQEINRLVKTTLRKQVKDLPNIDRANNLTSTYGTQ